MVENIYDKKYDRSTKTLLNRHEKEIVNFLLKTDITNFKSEDREINLPEKHVDSVFRINGEYILHFEFQTKYEEGMEEKMLLYNLLLRNKFQCEVQSILVYLTNYR